MPALPAPVFTTPHGLPSKLFQLLRGTSTEEEYSGMFVPSMRTGMSKNRKPSLWRPSLPARKMMGLLPLFWPWNPEPSLKNSSSSPAMSFFDGWPVGVR